MKMSEGLGGWVRCAEDGRGPLRWDVGLTGRVSHSKKGTRLPVEASTATDLAKALAAMAALRSDPKLRGSEPDTGPLTVREISSLT